MIKEGKDCPNCGEPTEVQIQEFGRRCKNCDWVESRNFKAPRLETHIDFSMLKKHEIRYIKNRDNSKIINHFLLNAP